MIQVLFMCAVAEPEFRDFDSTNFCIENVTVFLKKN